MLHYLGAGERHFGLAPVVPYSRLNWEIYAVLSGPCAPILLPHLPEQPLQTHGLWIFPPEATHGWTGDPAHPCQVACFHFSHLLPSVETLARASPPYFHPLAETQRHRVAHLAAHLRTHLDRPATYSEVHFHHAMSELCLMAIADLPDTPLPAPVTTAKGKVEAAENWFTAHLARNPPIEEIAEQVKSSPRHLRRLFLEIRHDTPRTVFQRIRMSHAQTLLSQTSLTLDTISRQCGYSTVQDFCRAFKTLHHVTADTWRRNTAAAIPRP